MVLRDDQWEQIAPRLPGKAGDPGRSAANNRLFLEAVLWMARTGAPWRDLPEAFGNWNSVFRRFRRWVQKGVFERLFQALSGDPDFEYALIDGTVIRVHQHGTGAKGDLPSGHRALPRRPDDENRRPGGCARQPRALRAAARPTPRQHRCRPLARG